MYLNMLAGLNAKKLMARSRMRTTCSSTGQRLSSVQSAPSFDAAKQKGKMSHQPTCGHIYGPYLLFTANVWVKVWPSHPFRDNSGLYRPTW